MNIEKLKSNMMDAIATRDRLHIVDAFAGSLENREVYFFAAWNGGMPGAEAAALRMWDEAEKLRHSVDWGITIENGCVIEISKKPTVEE